MNELQSHIEFNDTTYSLERYPSTEDVALRAWSNAELLATQHLLETNLFADKSASTSIYLYNDRFGVWNCLLTPLLSEQQTIHTVTSYASQKKAITHNLELNELPEIDESTFFKPLDVLVSKGNKTVVLLKVPKSLDLFDLHLQQIHKLAMSDPATEIEVVCCFMTKYFTNSLVDMASGYFGQVEQSRAWKKSRLLLLSEPKAVTEYPETISYIENDGRTYEQYNGVFSADKIDIGTQFLLDQFINGNLIVKDSEQQILDLACGNGVIAREIADTANSDTQFTLVDDFNLAIESAKINMAGLKTYFICDDDLSTITSDSFDLVVSNPPFHFEYENNSEISLLLFKEVERVLKPGKRFILVANKHLNYKATLEDLFKKVFVTDTNRKFAIYECVS